MVTSLNIQHNKGFFVYLPGSNAQNIAPNRCVQAVNGDLSLAALRFVNENNEIVNLVDELGESLIIPNGQFIYGNFYGIAVNPDSVGKALLYLQ